MEPFAQLVALVEKLSKDRPFHQHPIAAETKAALEVIGPRSNPFFIVYAGPVETGGLLSAIEVRVPTGKGPARDGLVLLTIREAAGAAISQADVMKMWGKSPEVRPPSPRAPVEQPLYLVYKQPWGSLSFGFSRGEPSRLTDVVLDGTGK